MSALTTKITDYIESIPQPESYFAGTKFEVIEKYNIKQRGSIYEQIVQFILENEHDMGGRSNPSHDCSTDGEKIEIKGALSSKGDLKCRCIFNHIGFEKDWDKIWFACFTPDNKIYMALHDRETLKKLDVLKKQQGGKKSDNDDYMITTTNSEKIFAPDACLELKMYKL